ncbi:MAG: zinc-ribbon domain-containing protein [Candidatus Lokiarchaeota archaeon]|nr:zinc-ribbon domain-containing protein [Candidatus Lokiarchaeota archaeon]MBD3339798.1 zinc-ribbon domain-containing protein [Candidatus Lokiarchaeota archaeon]
MRKKKTILLIAFIIVITLALINNVSATPGYVGVNEQENYVWIIDFDEDVYNKYISDFPNDTSVPNYDDDLEAIQVSIEQLSAEQDVSVYNMNESIGSYRAVKAICYFFTSEDRENNDWELDSRKLELFIFKYDEDVYDLILFYGSLFIANNVDWNEIVSIMDEDLEDEGIDGDVQAIPGGIKVSMEMDNGKEIEIVSKYSPEGILESFDFTYDEETLFSYELEFNLLSNSLFWIIVITIIIIGIITALIILLHRQKKKREAFVESEDKQEDLEKAQKSVSKENEVIPKDQLKFCPYCGQSVIERQKFCAECGADLSKE